MARQTQPFGRRARPRRYPLHGDPRRGAGLEAPTAPHATSPVGRPARLSGPARFWDPRGLRVALAISFALSLAAHWFVAPWNLLPPDTGIELLDAEGELAIPIDVFGAELEPEPAPEPAPPEPAEAPPEATDEDAPGKPDAGAAIVDAGAPEPVRDAGADAGEPADAESPAEEPRDAGSDADGEGLADVEPTDAGASDAGDDDDDAGLVADLDDAGGAAGGPRDPESMFGLTKTVHAGVQNVVLGVNVALIRKHPVGGRLGPVLQEIPQWKDFLRGAPAPVDPIRHTDWILIYGPSLIHTERDAVLVRYNLPDDVVDVALDGIARSYDQGGAYDAGVPGVKASLGWADNAQRAFVRPQAKLLVIVPPSHAREAALTFRRQVPRGPPAGEAVRLIVRNPSNQISIPGLKFSKALSELRLWIVPRGDGGADVHMEGDCDDPEAAADSAARLTELLRRQNSLGVRIATRGLLNNVQVVAEGSKLKLDTVATAEQLEAVLQLAAAAFGAQLAPPPGGTPPGPN